ncbi:hypothetical protein CROQUDRAFT_708528, partial [Cronartium quercuum f. sp. fusiforme G11]
METAFNRNRYNPAYHPKVTKWATAQKQRLRAFSPEFSKRKIIERILWKCNNDIRSTVLARLGDSDKWSKFLIILEETCRNHAPSTRNTRLRNVQTTFKANEEKRLSNWSNKVQPHTTKLKEPLKCPKCGSTEASHQWKTCKGKGKAINNIDSDQNKEETLSNHSEEQDMEFVEYTDSHKDSDEDVEAEIGAIEAKPLDDHNIAQLQAETETPWMSSKEHMSKHTTDAKLLLTRPSMGKAHRTGAQSITTVIINGKEVKLLLDTGASCSAVGSKYLSKIVPHWEKHLLNCDNMTFSGCAAALVPLGVIVQQVIFPHVMGNVRILPEFVVMDNMKAEYLILGAEWLNIYGINIHNARERYFTINDNQHIKFALLTKNIISAIRRINLNPDETEENEIKKGIDEAKFGPKLTKEQKTSVEYLITKYNDQFDLGNNNLGEIKNHPVHVQLNVEKPYPPILKKNAYPASPRNRVEIEKHIDELLKMKVIRKVGEDESVDITTPVIIAWHNGKSRL